MFPQARDSIYSQDRSQRSFSQCSSRKEIELTETELNKVEDDAKASLAHTKDEIDKLDTSVTGWIKTHTAWAIGVVCFVVGALLGHWLHR